MTGNEIISLILSDLGIKAPTFAKTIGVQYQRILDIQSGKTKRISSKLAESIVEAYPKYNKVWLLTGEGAMIKNSGNLIQGDVNGGVIQSGGSHQNINISLPSEGEQKIIRPDGTVIVEKESETSLSKALSALAEQQKTIAKSQEQIDRLLTLLEQK